LLVRDFVEALNVIQQVIVAFNATTAVYIVWTR